MRIIDIIEDTYDGFWSRLYRRFLRLRYRYLSEEQLRPGHRYRDMLSGEELTVASVGRQVSVERQDADRQKVYSAPKTEVQLALDMGLLSHNKRRCPACPNVNR